MPTINDSKLLKPQTLSERYHTIIRALENANGDIKVIKKLVFEMAKLHEQGHLSAIWFFDGKKNFDFLSKIHPEDLPEDLPEDTKSEEQLKHALCLLAGIPFARDVNKAKEYLLRAANAGNVNAQYYLGIMYKDCDQIKKDSKEAIMWLTMAAEQGHVGAQYNLISFYGDDEGVEKNIERAVYWCEKAAQQNHTLAQYCMGEMYYNGYIGHKNYKKAARWYREASDQGDSDAKKMLESLQAHGYGIKRDEKNNVKILNISAYYVLKKLFSPVASIHDAKMYNRHRSPGSFHELSRAIQNLKAWRATKRKKIERYTFNLDKKKPIIITSALINIFDPNSIQQLNGTYYSQLAKIIYYLTYHLKFECYVLINKELKQVHSVKELLFRYAGSDGLMTGSAEKVIDYIPTPFKSKYGILDDAFFVAFSLMLNMGKSANIVPSDLILLNQQQKYDFEESLKRLPKPLQKLKSISRLRGDFQSSDNEVYDTDISVMQKKLLGKFIISTRDLISSLRGFSDTTTDTYRDWATTTSVDFNHEEMTKNITTVRKSGQKGENKILKCSPSSIERRINNGCNEVTLESRYFVLYFCHDFGVSDHVVLNINNKVCKALKIGSPYNTHNFSSETVLLGKILTKNRLNTVFIKGINLDINSLTIDDSYYTIYQTNQFPNLNVLTMEGFQPFMEPIPPRLKILNISPRTLNNRNQILRLTHSNIESLIIQDKYCIPDKNNNIDISSAIKLTKLQIPLRFYLYYKLDRQIHELIVKKHKKLCIQLTGVAKSIIRKTNFHISNRKDLDTINNAIKFICASIAKVEKKIGNTSTDRMFNTLLIHSMYQLRPLDEYGNRLECNPYIREVFRVSGDSEYDFFKKLQKADPSNSELIDKIFGFKNIQWSRYIPSHTIKSTVMSMDLSSYYVNPTIRLNDAKQEHNIVQQIGIYSVSNGEELDPREYRIKIYNTILIKDNSLLPVWRNNSEKDVILSNSSEFYNAHKTVLKSWRKYRAKFKLSVIKDEWHELPNLHSSDRIIFPTKFHHSITLGYHTKKHCYVIKSKLTQSVIVEYQFISNYSIDQSRHNLTLPPHPLSINANLSCIDQSIFTAIKKLEREIITENKKKYFQDSHRHVLLILFSALRERNTSVDDKVNLIINFCKNKIKDKILKGGLTTDPASTVIKIIEDGNGACIQKALACMALLVTYVSGCLMRVNDCHAAIELFHDNKPHHNIDLGGGNVSNTIEFKADDNNDDATLYPDPYSRPMDMKTHNENETLSITERKSVNKLNDTQIDCNREASSSDYVKLTIEPRTPDVDELKMDFSSLYPPDEQTIIHPRSTECIIALLHKINPSDVFYRLALNGKRRNNAITAIARYCKMHQRKFFVVYSAKQLEKLFSNSTHISEVGQAVIVPGLFVRILNKRLPITLIIVWHEFSLQELFTWKLLLDRLIPCEYIGEPLAFPEHLNIINITAPDMNAKDVFGSRLRYFPINATEFKATNIESSLPTIRCTEDNKPESFIDIQGERWRDVLFGAPILDMDGSFKYQAGCLSQYAAKDTSDRENDIKCKANIALCGLPRKEETIELRRILHAISNGQIFEINGESYTLLQNVRFTLHQRKWMVLRSLTTISINAEILKNYRKILYMHEDNFESIMAPVVVQSLNSKYAMKSPTIGKLSTSIPLLDDTYGFQLAVLSDDLSQAQRQRLKNWQQFHKQSNIRFATINDWYRAINNSPEDINADEKSIASLRQTGGLIFSDDYVAIQELINRSSHQEWTVLRINSTVDVHDLIGIQEWSKTNNTTKTRKCLLYTYRIKSLLKMLYSGQSVILSGPISKSLYDSLQSVFFPDPYIISNGKPVPIRGNLIINTCTPIFPLQQIGGRKFSVPRNYLRNCYEQSVAESLKCTITALRNNPLWQRLIQFINSLTKIHEVHDDTLTSVRISLSRLRNSMQALTKGKSIKPYWLYEFKKSCPAYLKLNIIRKIRFESKNMRESSKLNRLKPSALPLEKLNALSGNMLTLIAIFCDKDIEGFIDCIIFDQLQYTDEIISFIDNCITKAKKNLLKANVSNSKSTVDKATSALKMLGDISVRHKYHQRLDDLLKMHKIVCLIGPSGSGKTMLAEHYLKSMVRAIQSKGKSAIYHPDLTSWQMGQHTNANEHETHCVFVDEANQLPLGALSILDNRIRTCHSNVQTIYAVYAINPTETSGDRQEHEAIRDCPMLRIDRLTYEFVVSVVTPLAKKLWKNIEIQRKKTTEYVMQMMTWQKNGIKKTLRDCQQAMIIDAYNTDAKIDSDDLNRLFKHMHQRGFLLCKKTKSRLADIHYIYNLRHWLQQHAIKNNFYSKRCYLIQGPSGIGKSELCKQYLYSLSQLQKNKPDKKTTRPQYIHISAGSTKFCQSRIVMAYQQGIPVILDEFNVIPDIEYFFSRLVRGHCRDDNGQFIESPENNNFFVLGTQNQKEYAQVSALPYPLLNRIHRKIWKEFSDNDLLEMTTKALDKQYSKRNPNSSIENRKHDYNKFVKFYNIKRRRCPNTVNTRTYLQLITDKKEHVVRCLLKEKERLLKYRTIGMSNTKCVELKINVECKPRDLKPRLIKRLTKLNFNDENAVKSAIALIKSYFGGYDKIPFAIRALLSYVEYRSQFKSDYYGFIGCVGMTRQSVSRLNRLICAQRTLILLLSDTLDSNSRVVEEKYVTISHVKIFKHWKDVESVLPHSSVISSPNEDKICLHRLKHS